MRTRIIASLAGLLVLFTATSAAGRATHARTAHAPTTAACDGIYDHAAAGEAAYEQYWAGHICAAGTLCLNGQQPWAKLALATQQRWASASSAGTASACGLSS